MRAYSNSIPFPTFAVRSGARQGVARRGRRYRGSSVGVLWERFSISYRWVISYTHGWNGFTAYDYSVRYSRSIEQECRGREDIAHQMNTQDEWLRAISISISAYERFRSLNQNHKDTSYE